MPTIEVWSPELVPERLRSVFACDTVRSSGSPLEGLVRPLNVAVGTSASLVLVTTLGSIVSTVPLPETVMSP